MEVANIILSTGSEQEKKARIRSVLDKVKGEVSAKAFDILYREVERLGLSLAAATAIVGKKRDWEMEKQKSETPRMPHATKGSATVQSPKSRIEERDMGESAMKKSELRKKNEEEAAKVKGRKERSLSSRKQDILLRKRGIARKDRKKQEQKEDEIREDDERNSRRQTEKSST